MRTEIRALRHALRLSQHAFAQRLGVSLETLRPWDSGRRRTPAAIVTRARAMVCEPDPPEPLLSLDVLAEEFGMHQRTLRDAVRLGRLTVHLSTRSAFGRPIRLATRTAVREYQEHFYRRAYSRMMLKPPKPTRPCVPQDAGERSLSPGMR